MRAPRAIRLADVVRRTRLTADEIRRFNPALVKQVPDKFTASFFCSTDTENNQIASFYTGAMADAVIRFWAVEHMIGMLAATAFVHVGNGTNIDSNMPVAVSGGLMFASVSAGSSHSCGVTIFGATYCWGNNGAGQLGNGTNAAMLLAIRSAERLQPLIDHRRNARDDIRRDVVQARHSRQHVGTQILRQQRRQLRRAASVEMREDQRNRLRVLAEDELRQLLGVGFLE